MGRRWVLVSDVTPRSWTRGEDDHQPPALLHAGLHQLQMVCAWGQNKGLQMLQRTFQSGSPCGIFTFANFYTSVVCWSPVNQHNLKTKKRREGEGCDSEEENGMQKLQWLYAYAVMMQMWTVRNKKEKKIEQHSNRALMSDLPRVCRPSRGWTVDIHTSPRGQRAGGLRWTDRVSPQWLCPCSAFDRPRRHRTSPHLENTRKCVLIKGCGQTQWWKK